MRRRSDRDQRFPGGRWEARPTTGQQCVHPGSEVRGSRDGLGAGIGGIGVTVAVVQINREVVVRGRRPIASSAAAQSPPSVFVLVVEKPTQRWGRQNRRSSLVNHHPEASSAGPTTTMGTSS
jgi:hypothetical protein